MSKMIGAHVPAHRPTSSGFTPHKHVSEVKQIRTAANSGAEHFWGAKANRERPAFKINFRNWNTK